MRLGDVYGPTVSTAARLTSLARPARSCSTAAHEALRASDPDEDDFRLRRIRRTSVKGYSRLEPWRLKRARVLG